MDWFYYQSTFVKCYLVGENFPLLFSVSVSVSDGVRKEKIFKIVQTLTPTPTLI